MRPVDLITGFLGSGKTTFITAYGKYLIRQGIRPGFIENDYGAVNVDMLLLENAFGSDADTEMIIAEDPECHRRRFTAKLITYGMTGVGHVVVEPSGIYDADEFFDVLHDDPLERWFQPGSVLAIVDARLSAPLSKETRYLLVSQIADAGAVILSRTQDASDEEIRGTVDCLNRVCDEFQCGRHFELGKDVVAKDWRTFTDDDFEAFRRAGCRMTEHLRLQTAKDNDFSSVYCMNLTLLPSDLAPLASSLFSDPLCGTVLRIKGFTKGTDGSWTELNATPREIRTSPSAAGQQVLIIIGESLDRTRIESHLRPFRP